MSPNEREIAEGIWYIRDAIEQLDQSYDSMVDKIAVKEALHQALEFLGATEEDDLG